MTTPVQKMSNSLLGRLRFPQAFVILATLFLIDLFVPDLVPFIDEIILAGLTLLTAMWQKERPSATAAEKPPEKNVTPRD